MKPIPHVTARLEDPRESSPPRSRWIWWTLGAVAVIWLLLAGTWLGMLVLADRQLDDVRQEARARHEPIDLSDFIQTPVAKEENAVTHLLRACDEYHENERETGQNWEMLHRSPLSPQAVTILRPYLHANAQALAELRAMRQCSRTNWNLFNPGDSNERLRRRFLDRVKSLSQQRQMAELLSTACLVAHRDGDDAAAMEYLRDILAIARVTDGAPDTVSHMVSVGIEALACESTMDIASHLNWTSISASPKAMHLADRAQVEALIADLLEESQRTQRARRAYWADRALTLDVAGMNTTELRLSNDQRKVLLVRMPPSRILLELLRLPVQRKVAADSAKSFGEAGDAVAGVTAPAAATVLISTVGRPTASNLPLAQWIREGQGNDRSVDIHFRGAAERRIAAAMLAIRLYQLDHAGEFPANLKQLQGRYLKPLPDDPFAPAARPIGYFHNGREVLVYSVFENARDDIAAGWRPPAGPYNEWTQPDLAFRYHRNPPSSAPSTAPAPLTTPATSRPGNTLHKPSASR